MPVVVCPGCSVRIQVKAGTVGRFRCVKCGQVLAINLPGGESKAPAGTSAGPNPENAWESSILPQSPLPASNPFPAQTMLPKPRSPLLTSRRTSQTGKWDPGFPSFLKRLGIALAILVVVLALLAGVGFAAEPVAFVAVGVALVAAFGLALTGRIWIIVIAFQESVVQGLLALFVPYYWLYFVATRKGRCGQALSVFGSALVPGLCGVLMVFLFEPYYSHRGPRPFHVPQGQLAKIEQRIRESRETSPNPDVLRSVSFRVHLLQQPNPHENAERALARLPGYVPGSFRLSDDRKSVSFQYKGEKLMASHYAMFLPAEAGIMMDLDATFQE